MTKLEQKLIELGYQEEYCHFRNHKQFYRFYNENKVVIIIEKNKLKRKYISSTSITSQENIDDLQLAFNEMQKDLSILKECEKKNEIN